MSLLPASLKRIRSISTEIKWWLQFFRRSKAANSVVSGWIWPKSKLIQAFMHVLVTCKYENDPIKNSQENAMTLFSPVYGIFFWCSRVANSMVGGPIWRKFKLIQDIIHVLIPESLKRSGSIATEKKCWHWFFRSSRAANSVVSGGIWLKVKLIRAFMNVLITCKYEKNPIKNSRENVMTFSTL